MASSASANIHMDFVSDSSLIVRVPGPPSLEASRRILLFFEYLLSGRERYRITNLHPAYTSLLIDFDPQTSEPRQFFQEIQKALQDIPLNAESLLTHKTVTVPVVYGESSGPDLDEVAAQTGLSPEEILRRHSEAEYHVAFLGFCPGFPYLLGLPKELFSSRKSSPRLRVPAGSVAIAGPQAGIYPRESPAGWQWIGQTNLNLFQPEVDSPALLTPGDRVRFEVVTSLAADLPTMIPTVEQQQKPELTNSPVLEVELPGFFSTIQDLGREGWAHLGVSHGGAADPAALRMGNAIIGNHKNAAAIEITAEGGRFRFLTDTWFTVVGADCAPHLEPYDVAMGAAIPVYAGQRLILRKTENLLRSYLCIHGGFEVPELLGSRSTLVSGSWGGLDGRPLKTGDILYQGTQEQTPPRFRRHSTFLRQLYAEPPKVLRILRGPQWQWFSTTGQTTLTTTDFEVTTDLNRLGLRLRGEPLELTATYVGQELESEGVAGGALQVSPNGQVMILFCEQQTTGGYPKIAHVIRADSHYLGQLTPGTRFRFQEISLEEAWELNHHLEAALADPLDKI